MRLESMEAFEKWASATGVTIRSPEAPDQVWLSPPGTTSQYRYWDTPGEPAHMLIFVTTLLETFDPWEYCWVVKRIGDWSCGGPARADDLEDLGYELILRNLGIEPGFEGAICFHKEERHALTLLLFTEIAFGSNGFYDMWIAPDHARQLILTEDDDITEMYFCDEAAADQAVALLASRWFPLSEDPPMPGMPRQSWMPSIPSAEEPVG